jgi:hypothetical protein
MLGVGLGEQADENEQQGKAGSNYEAGGKAAATPSLANSVGRPDLGQGGGRAWALRWIPSCPNSPPAVLLCCNRAHSA